MAPDTRSAELNAVPPTVSMRFGIVTLFPQMFGAVSEYGVTGRAMRTGLIELHCWNPRDYSTDASRRVDDRPYGGGPGMVLQAPPLAEALRTARASLGGDAHSVALSPQGRCLSQRELIEIARTAKPLIMLCGRYEGIDERLLRDEVDEEWSLGDFVISGGELAAMVLIDAIARHVPGVLGDARSASEDSFASGLLDAPHYTRPEQYAGQGVPPVLISGNHQAVRRWRLKQALGRTWQRRPELLAGRTLDSEQSQLLAEYREELVAHSVAEHSTS